MRKHLIAAIIFLFVILTPIAWNATNNSDGIPDNKKYDPKYDQHGHYYDSDYEKKRDREIRALQLSREHIAETELKHQKVAEERKQRKAIAESTPKPTSPVQKLNDLEKAVSDLEDTVIWLTDRIEKLENQLAEAKK